MRVSTSLKFPVMLLIQEPHCLLPVCLFHISVASTPVLGRGPLARPSQSWVQIAARGILAVLINAAVLFKANM